MPSKSNARMIVGLMSGTSVDGIDAALVRVWGRNGSYHVEVAGHVERKWPKKVRERLLRAMAPANTTTVEICELNAIVAREFAAAVEACAAKLGGKDRITAIGSHGQTVCHLPPIGTKPGNTLQLGDASILATLTGITTVGNFRPADMAVGGQGAPLVPWTDDVLLSDARQIRCVQNIGGIANVTYLPRKNDPQRRIVAFDTGPGNMVMDAVVTIATDGSQGYDKGGRLAKKGVLIPELFRELQSHSYFERKPPKSTGRELFGRTFAEGIWKKWRKRGIEDVVHTLARWTAWSIADAYLHFLPELPDEVILCGGGADNPVLMKMFADELAELTSDYTTPMPPVLRRIDEFGIPNKAKEAASFALLAAATLDGVPGNLPSVTGAARPVVLGVVARPHTTKE